MSLLPQFVSEVPFGCPLVRLDFLSPDPCVILQLTSGASKGVVNCDVTILVGVIAVIVVTDYECVPGHGYFYDDFVYAALVMMLMRGFDRYLTVCDSVVIVSQRFYVFVDVRLECGRPVHIVEMCTRWDSHA